MNDNVTVIVTSLKNVVFARKASAGKSDQQYFGSQFDNFRLYSRHVILHQSA